MKDNSDKSATLSKHVLRRLFYIAPSVFVCILSLPVNTWARGPLTKAEVIDILKTSEPSFMKEFVIKHRAKLYGVEFPMTQDTESELRRAGASEPLLSALRALAPPLQPQQPPPLRPLVEGTYQLDYIQESLNYSHHVHGTLVLSKLSDDDFRFEMNFDDNKFQYKGRFKPSPPLWNGTIESYSEFGKTDPDNPGIIFCYATEEIDNSLEVAIGTRILHWRK